MQFFQLILLIELENKISSLIHPTAIIAENVELGINVKIGPFSIIERDVKIGDNCIIGNNVTIACDTIIGEKCKIFHSSSVGELPQDLKYDGEKTFTKIGNNTTIREFVTINKGTKELGKTEVGSNVLLTLARVGFFDTNLTRWIKWDGPDIQLEP